MHFAKLLVSNEIADLLLKHGAREDAQNYADVHEDRLAHSAERTERKTQVTSDPPSSPGFWTRLLQFYVDYRVANGGALHRGYGGQNAYGPGIHSDATGRPYTWQPTLGHTGGVLGPVKPNAYGPGIGMDATGKPVQAVPQY